jgi:hypothetical protein
VRARVIENAGISNAGPSTAVSFEKTAARHGSGRNKSPVNSYFPLTDDRAVIDSIPVFKGKERWQVWRRI